MWSKLDECNFEEMLIYKWELKLQLKEKLIDEVSEGSGGDVWQICESFRLTRKWQRGFILRKIKEFDSITYTLFSGFRCAED